MVAKVKPDLAKAFPLFAGVKDDKSEAKIRDPNIIQKSPQRSNIVFILPNNGIASIDSSLVLGLFKKEQLAGMTLTDDPALQLRIFNFPAAKMKIIFEENRIRFEDETALEPDLSFASEVFRIYATLLRGINPTAFGFNYDIFYRFDNVLAWRNSMSAFLDEEILDDVKDFGWQFSLNKTKEQKTESYFLKLISPIELALHTNHHFLHWGPKDAKELGLAYKSCWKDTDEIFKHMAL